jgi:RNA polymerase sigma factor (sigma-70 family)
MTPLLTSALLRTQSDERLVVLVRSGQERAFEAIVERYRKPLQRYCERALPRSRAEDVVQQVWTKVWCALQEGTEVRSLKPWLYRIAATTIFETSRMPGYDYDELRRSLLESGEPEAELEQQAIIRKTLAGLAALPEAQREALLRDAFEGQSRAQIAEALGVSEGAVRQLLHRARATLRAAVTAITPVPLVSWLAASGSGPVAGGALESGAAGAVGVAGVAKVSAIVATAGVVVSGSAAVHHQQVEHARKARADYAKHSVVRRHGAEAKLVRADPMARSTVSTQVHQDREQRSGGGGGVSETEHANNGTHEASQSREQDARQSNQRGTDQEMSGRQQRPAQQPDEKQLPESGQSGQSGSEGGDAGN